jgi:hypothetical protein
MEGRAINVKTRGICSIDGCDAPHKAHGWCRRHYYRWQANGDPLVMRPRGGAYGSGGGVRPGAEHHRWSGDTPTYDAAHKRVRRAFGKATTHTCVDCGVPAYAWSYNHRDPNEVTAERRNHGGTGSLGVVQFSADPKYYEARCASCHTAFDSAASASMEG